MRTEDKQLLLNDLCSRLPYGVRIKDKYGITTLTDIDCYDLDEVTINNLGEDMAYLQDIKPYLFPLSSLTEGNLNEICKYAGLQKGSLDIYEWSNPSNTLEFFLDEVSVSAVMRVFEWLNKNHIDYNGLINKGLAIDVTKLNIY
jgi:hypothetical protein